MRLGYPRMRGRRIGGFRGFNEAEAHAPRIRWDTDPTNASRDSFNEAEAHAPRIQIGRATDAARKKMLQ